MNITNNEKLISSIIDTFDLEVLRSDTSQLKAHSIIRLFKSTVKFDTAAFFCADVSTIPDATYSGVILDGQKVYWNGMDQETFDKVAGYFTVETAAIDDQVCLVRADDGKYYYGHTTDELQMHGPREVACYYTYYNHDFHELGGAIYDVEELTDDLKTNVLYRPNSDAVASVVVQNENKKSPSVGWYRPADDCSIKNGNYITPDGTYTVEVLKNQIFAGASSPIDEDFLPVRSDVDNAVICIYYRFEDDTLVWSNGESSSVDTFNIDYIENEIDGKLDITGPELWFKTEDGDAIKWINLTESNKAIEKVGDIKNIDVTVEDHFFWTGKTHAFSMKDRKLGKKIYPIGVMYYKTSNLVLNDEYTTRYDYLTMYRESSDNLVSLISSDYKDEKELAPIIVGEIKDENGEKKLHNGHYTIYLRNSSVVIGEVDLTVSSYEATSTEQLLNVIENGLSPVGEEGAFNSYTFLYSDYYTRDIGAYGSTPHESLKDFIRAKLDHFENWPTNVKYIYWITSLPSSDAKIYNAFLKINPYDRGDDTKEAVYHYYVNTSKGKLDLDLTMRQIYNEETVRYGGYREAKITKIPRSKIRPAEGSELCIGLSTDSIPYIIAPNAYDIRGRVYGDSTCYIDPLNPLFNVDYQFSERLVHCKNGEILPIPDHVYIEVDSFNDLEDALKRDDAIYIVHQKDPDGAPYTGVDFCDLYIYSFKTEEFSKVENNNFQELVDENPNNTVLVSMPIDMARGKLFNYHSRMWMSSIYENKWGVEHVRFIPFGDPIRVADKDENLQVTKEHLPNNFFRVENTTNATFVGSEEMFIMVSGIPHETIEVHQNIDRKKIDLVLNGTSEIFTFDISSYWATAQQEDMVEFTLENEDNSYQVILGKKDGGGISVSKSYMEDGSAVYYQTSEGFTSDDPMKHLGYIDYKNVEDDAESWTIVPHGIIDVEVLPATAQPMDIYRIKNMEDPAEDATYMSLIDGDNITYTVEYSGDDAFVITDTDGFKYILTANDLDGAFDTGEISVGGRTIKTEPTASGKFPCFCKSKKVWYVVGEDLKIAGEVVLYHFVDGKWRELGSGRHTINLGFEAQLPAEGEEQCFYRRELDVYEFIDRYKLLPTYVAHGYYCSDEGLYDPEAEQLIPWFYIAANWVVINPTTQEDEGFDQYFYQNDFGDIWFYNYNTLDMIHYGAEEPDHPYKKEIWVWFPNDEQGWYLLWDSCGSVDGANDYNKLVNRPLLNKVIIQSSKNTEDYRITWYGTREEYNELEAAGLVYPYTIYIITDSEPEEPDSYHDLKDKPQINEVELDGNKNSEEIRVFWKGTQVEYDALGEHYPYCLYIITDNTDPTIHDDYNDLDNKPAINNVVLTGFKSLEELGIYSRDDVDHLIASVKTIHFVNTAPTNPEPNTTYYIGTEAPYQVVVYDSDLNPVELGDDKIDLEPYQKKVDTALYTSAKSVVGAINEMEERLGKNPDLETVHKNTIVAAINELIGRDGNLDDLETLNKDTLVDAINETIWLSDKTIDCLTQGGKDYVRERFNILLNGTETADEILAKLPEGYGIRVNSNLLNSAPDGSHVVNVVKDDKNLDYKYIDGEWVSQASNYGTVPISVLITAHGARADCIRPDSVYAYKFAPKMYYVSMKWNESFNLTTQEETDLFTMIVDGLSDFDNGVLTCNKFAVEVIDNTLHVTSDVTGIGQTVIISGVVKAK